MASSLYPGWGSGTKTLDLSLPCHSFAAAGLDPEMDRGDRIILPASAFKEVSRLRLPFPLYFGVWPTKGMKARRAKHKEAQAALKRRRNRLRGGEVLEEVVTPPGQYCSVLEFSAPEGVIQMPQWIMDNLNVKHGGRVHLMSVPYLPKGQFARLQPVESAFSELLARLGPKFFLESALRRYSVLSRGERIMVEHGGKQHFVRVLDVRPDNSARTVSLLGTVDLEVDFAPALDDPEGLAEWKRGEEARREADKKAAAAAGGGGGGKAKKAAPRGKPASAAAEDAALQEALARSLAEHGGAPPPAEEREPTPRSPANDSDSGGSAAGGADAADAVVGCVADASYMWGDGVSDDEADTPEEEPVANDAFGWRAEDEEEDEEEEKGAEAGAAPAAAAPARPLPASGASAVSFSSAGSGGSAGRRLDEPASPRGDKQECDNCGRLVPRTSAAMHEMHCRRQYSRCGECGEAVRHLEMEAHVAAHRPVLCECGEEVEASALADHKARRCLKADAQCGYCRVTFERGELLRHEEACGRRTDQCDECGRWIKLHDMALHEESGCALPAAASPAPAARAPAASAAEGSVRADVEQRMQALDDELVSRIKAVSEVTAYRDMALAAAEGASPPASPVAAPAAPAPAPASPAAPAERLPCPQCSTTCLGFEELQVHMLTACAKGGGGSKKAKKRRSKVGLGGRRVRGAGPVEGTPAPPPHSPPRAGARHTRRASGTSSTSGRGSADGMAAGSALNMVRRKRASAGKARAAPASPPAPAPAQAARRAKLDTGLRRGSRGGRAADGAAAPRRRSSGGKAPSLARDAAAQGEGGLALAATIQGVRLAGSPAQALRRRP